MIVPEEARESLHDQHRLGAVADGEDVLRAGIGRGELQRRLATDQTPHVAANDHGLADCGRPARNANGRLAGVDGLLQGFAVVALAVHLGAEVGDHSPVGRVVPRHVRRFLDGQPKRPGPGAGQPGAGPLGDRRPGDGFHLGLVVLANGAGITVADQIANEHAAGRQFDRRHCRRGAHASEFCVDEREESTPLVLPENGHAVFAHKVADRDRLAVVVPAQFVLAVKRDILQHHAVDPELGGNPRVEAADPDILDEARAEVVGVAHIQSDHALAVTGANVDVAKTADIAGVEPYADSARDYRVRCPMCNCGSGCGIAALGAARPNHFLGLCRIVETGAMVTKFEDRLIFFTVKLDRRGRISRR